MDFITKKFENRIRISSVGSTSRGTLLKARIEYLYYFMLGILWGSQKSTLSKDELTKFISKLDGQLTLGRIIGSLKSLDKNHDLLSWERSEHILQKYKKYRDENIGHGYVFDDGAQKFECALADMFLELTSAIPLLQKPMDIIVVNDKSISDTDTVYSGFVFKVDDRGDPAPWQCSANYFDSDGLTNLPQVYYRIENCYYKVSPFIWVEGVDAKVFVFNSIKQKLTGETEFTQLFETNRELKKIPEFIDTSITNEHCRISSNSTIMNLFSVNYSTYVDVGVISHIREFLTKNSSYVSAVLWGNGGVGKTACAQKICMDLYHDMKQHFKYIVFVTAKNRRLNEVTGLIENLDNKQDFFGIVDSVHKVIKNAPLDCEENSDKYNKFLNEIIKMTGDIKLKTKCLLLVIDDFETFDDTEKEKISSFIGKLNVNSHKVIITTRNSRLAEGYRIPTNELTPEHTMNFIREKIKEKYPNSIHDFETKIKDKDVASKIYKATSGTPIFILQWLHLYVQNPSETELYQQLSSKVEAREFLSGRVYESLREDAKLLYATLSAVSSPDQTFQVERLRYVCEKYMSSDNFDDAFNELEQICIIEPYQIDPQNRIMSIYRVYTKSFLDDMSIRYKELAESVRESVRRKLESSGGNTAKYTLYTSLLIEARQSRGTNNEANTVSKYRHIINLPECPLYQKKQALIELIGYFFSFQDKPEKAIETINSYDKKLSYDPQVMYKYIYYLWGAADRAYKSVAFEELKNYFKTESCVTSQNLQFFALGAAYYTIYILDNPSEKHNNQEKDAYSICSSLYTFISSAHEAETEKIIRKFRHEVKMALYQFIRLAANLSIIDSSYASDCVSMSKFFLNEFADASLECAAVRKQIVSVKPLVKPTRHENSSKSNDVVPDGCVMLSPRYIKYNVNGLPQYLNGTVGDTKGGVAWYDFDKFGWEQLSRYGGTEKIMEQLIDKGTPIPAVITSISDSGMYSLSLFDTKFALCDLIDLIEWEATPCNEKSHTSETISKDEPLTDTILAQEPPTISAGICIGQNVSFSYVKPFISPNGKVLGVIGEIESGEIAMLHITQLRNSFITSDEMQRFVDACSVRGQFMVTVTKKTDRGYQVSLLNSSPGFNEFISN